MKKYFVKAIVGKEQVTKTYNEETNLNVKILNLTP